MTVARLGLAAMALGGLVWVGCGSPGPAAGKAKTAADGPTGPRGGPHVGALARERSFDVIVARELDQQGVRLFTDGRYREAQQLFERAHARGGPSSELWNIARCQQKLDDTKGAMETLTEYVSKRDIEHGEREEAQRELEVLRRKPVRVVVVTEPPGASVVVGERKMTPMGRTPAAFDLAPGDYAVTLTLAGYSRKVVRFVAESGSPVTIAEELSPK